MPAQPTGRHERRDGVDVMVLERTFAAPATEVWAAITRPERLARWIGTWAGDPAEGHVRFRMTSEGEDVAEEVYRILECAPDERLRLHSENDYGVWDLDLRLSESAGTTILAFGQVVHDPASLESVGPGWDYYLDRLVAAETGGDPAALDWADYYPALADHYRELGAAIGS